MSNKHCGDPAAAWERGVGGEGGAPALVVESWAELPAKLLEAGAGDAEKRAANRETVRDYYARLTTRLREDLVSRSEAAASRPSTTACSVTAWSQDEARDLVDAAAAYYDSPGWFDDPDADGPGRYAAGCGHAMHTGYSPNGTPSVRVQRNVNCYDAACVPPTVKEFSCGAADKAR